jgi:hypothetical protein
MLIQDEVALLSPRSRLFSTGNEHGQKNACGEITHRYGGQFKQKEKLAVPRNSFFRPCIFAVTLLSTCQMVHNDLSGSMVNQLIDFIGSGICEGQLS